MEESARESVCMPVRHALVCRCVCVCTSLYGFAFRIQRSSGQLIDSKSPPWQKIHGLLPSPLLWLLSLYCWFIVMLIWFLLPGLPLPRLSPSGGLDKAAQSGLDILIQGSEKVLRESRVIVVLLFVLRCIRLELKQWLWGWSEAVWVSKHICKLAAMIQFLISAFINKWRINYIKSSSCVNHTKENKETLHIYAVWSLWV